MFLKRLLFMFMFPFFLVKSNITDQNILNINPFWCSRGHFNYDQAEFLMELASLLQPSFIIETGFCTGRSASCILQSIKNGKKFISIDINLDYMRLGREYAQILIDAFPIFSIIERDSKLLLSNQDFFKKNFEQKLDWATIDGDHTYQGCFKDLNNISSYMDEKGIIIIDDYKSGPPNGFRLESVIKSVDDFLTNNNQWQKLEWNKKGKGFAILTKSMELYEIIKKTINKSLGF